MAEAPQKPKMYVDPELCTGCGLCVQICTRGAIRMKETTVAGESTAEIDEALCTSCGRCAEECPLGAIVSVEVVTEMTAPEKRAATSEKRTATPPAPGAETRPSQPAEPPVPQTASPRSEVLEKAFSGVLSLAAWLLDRRLTRSRGSRTGGHPESRFGAGRGAGAGTGTGVCGGPLRGRRRSGKGLGHGGGGRKARRKSRCT